MTVLRPRSTCCHSMCVSPRAVCVRTNDFSVANLLVRHGDLSCC
ncbi:hypothetical protein PVAP13_4NG128800 [Panicum virgatum]|uniref:Uncharacterized protein n=1 Tax=Panicum virgatum TaxID=38727 RepID=A0A8T0T6V9_PANVG|nr:hypothetical protein PVAP13_4NG128800 [Panicum virgatum]